MRLITLGHADACRHAGCDRRGSRCRVRVVRTALAIVGPKALVRDSGEGTRSCSGLYCGVPHPANDRTRALDPAAGRQGAALLRHAVFIVRL